MSDFISNFWSVYITAITLGGIVACAVLLWATSRKKVVSGADNTTGHVWDEDLREMNNPLPLWWVGLFLMTILFSFGYLYLYPGLGSATGSYGWTSAGQYNDEVAQANAALKPLYAGFDAQNPEPLAKDAKADRKSTRLNSSH